MLFIAGVAAGIVSGMGIGGGALLIPALVFFAGIGQHEAQGINLIYFIPTAIAALVVHIRNKSVAFKAAIPVAFCGAFAALLGSYAAISINEAMLRKLFGVFLLFIGIYELFLRKSRKVDNDKK